MSEKIPIEISARHIHLSKEDLELLFGKGYQLKKLKDLTMLDRFAAKETVTVRFRNREIPKIRIIGPPRPRTQLEISLTDAYYLGLQPPIRKSGNSKKSPGILLIGPRRKANLKEGVIIAWRHIHLSPKEAERLGVKNGDFVSVKTDGNRAVTFHNVLIRVHKDYKLCLHLDTDEGNAAGIIKKGFGKLISQRR